MSEFDVSDEVLINQFKNGDIRSFNQIVIRYKDRLIHFIYGFVNDIDRAEDLVQDTFMKLYTHKDSYREIAKFSTWLYTIAGNLARTELRKLKRRKTYSISSLSKDDNDFIIKDDDRGPTEFSNDKYLQNKVEKALSRLSVDFRTMIILRDIQELSYDDISKIMDLPLGTVKSRINRGRLKLQNLIKNKEKLGD